MATLKGGQNKWKQAQGNHSPSPSIYLKLTGDYQAVVLDLCDNSPSRSGLSWTASWDSGPPQRLSRGRRSRAYRHSFQRCLGSDEHGQKSDLKGKKGKRIIGPFACPDLPIGGYFICFSTKFNIEVALMSCKFWNIWWLSNLQPNYTDFMP